MVMLKTKKNKQTYKKLQNYKKKSLKQKIMKHYYFINRCKYDKYSSLDDTILENYLKKLGCYPDKVMYNIINNDKHLVKKHNISYDDFCTYKKKIIVPSIKENIIADIFFYNINSKFLDKRLYKYPKFLLNILNIDFAKITNKNVIYDNIANIPNINPEVIKNNLIPTFPINEYSKYNFPDYYILRPNESFGGDNILYISSQNELDNAINYYKKTKNYKGKIHGFDVSASPYITNLLLFQGRKFHLRMYYIISCINGVINSFLLDNGDIMTARDKFDMKPPFSTYKHDTHLETTGGDFTIKDDFNSNNLDIEITPQILNSIFNKCKKLCSLITKIIIKNVIHKDYNNYNPDDTKKILYEDQHNGYHIFGVDIFINKNLEPILIECNSSPGFGTFTGEGNSKLSHTIYGWVNENILEPLLKYNDPLKARKHKTYINL